MWPELPGPGFGNIFYHLIFVIMEKFKKLNREEMKNVVGGKACQCFQYCYNPGTMCFSGAQQGICVAELCPIGNPCEYQYCSFL